MQAFKPTLLERVVLSLPWLGILWLIIQAFNDKIDGLFVFGLLFILVPLAVVVNAVSIIGIRGKSFMKQIEKAQKKGKSTPLKSTNYADLPKWDPRRKKK